MATATVETEYDVIPENWDGAEELTEDDRNYPESMHDEAPVDDAEMADPEAPYGRKADGTPKRKPGPQKKAGSGTAVPRAPRPAARAPRKTSGRRATSVATMDYTEAIKGLGQLVAIPLSLAGRANVKLAYDAATVVAFLPDVAEFGNELAQSEPKVAALLDKVMTIGPYGKGVALALGIGAQIAVNHGWIPLDAGKGMGAMEPEALMNHVAQTAN